MLDASVAARVAYSMSFYHLALCPTLVSVRRGHIQRGREI